MNCSSDYLIPAAAALLGAAFAFSCSKQDPYKEINEAKNPAVVSLPAAPFTLSATEVRSRDTGKTFEWTISTDGRTDSVTESIDSMYVTAANLLTFSAKGGSAAYKGVNVRSSNASAVVVRPVPGETDTWELVHAGEGEADIEVWNGEGKDTRKTVFHVWATKAVMPKAIVFLWQDLNMEWVEVRVTEFYNNREGFVNRATDWQNPDIGLPDSASSDAPDFLRWSNGPKRYHEVKFVRIEPENTSFRHIEWETDYVALFWGKWDAFLKTQDIENNWMEPFDGDVSDLQRNWFLTFGDLSNGMLSPAIMMNIEIKLKINVTESESGTVAFLPLYTVLTQNMHYIKK